MNPSPITQPRPSPLHTSHQLQPVARTSHQRDYWSPFPFSTAQLFQNWDCRLIRVTREDPAVVNEGQHAVARFFRSFDRNSGELIVYENYRMIAGTSPEKMTFKFSFYEDELIKKFKRTFENVGKDN
ncbi:hypothetical protein O181_019715 [Austropuccinia psidii MF-1]|uniref:Uncharacterized protein n=1 Tax=Austropuccinia psidii MF-1 TaxID=1389203 RepID=A0A9Q3CCD1_9BASI|nr:hypothetical protein [Austropuccinia psidii MF-1]